MYTRQKKSDVLTVYKSLPVIYDEYRYIMSMSLKWHTASITQSMVGGVRGCESGGPGHDHRKKKPDPTQLAR